MLVPHPHFLIALMWNALLWKPLHELLQVFFYLFDCHLERRGDVIGPLLLCDLLGRKLVLDLDEFLKRLLIFIRVDDSL